MTRDPIVLRTLSDTALAAPFMLGYWPDRSACVIVVDAEGRVLLIMRWQLDAPEVPPHLPLADQADAAAFHLVAFGPPSSAGVACQAIAEDISARGIALGDIAFVVRDGEDIVVMSGTPSGTGGAIRLTPEVVADAGARWDLRGWAISRSEYVSDIATDPVLVDDVATLLPGSVVLDESMRDQAIDDVRDTLISGSVTPRAIARTVVALADVRVRDTVLWDLLHASEDDWAEAADSLAEVVAGAPEGYVAPAATILAILRWQQGDGSRAAAAVERALEADPAYSLADLINRSLLIGLHPAVWAEGLAGMAREACRRAA